MKKTELRSLIRKAINEVLNEATVKTTINYKDPNKGDKILNIDPSDTETIKDITTDPNVASATMGSKKLKEMARTAIKYKLASDWENKLKQMPQYGKEKPMRWIQGIIDYIKDNGPDTIPNIALKKFNKGQPAIADYYRAMVSAGVIAPEDETVTPQFQREPVEKEPKDIFKGDAEDLFVGGGDYGDYEEPEEEEEPIEEPSAVSEPEKEPEIEEPSPDELEPAEPVSGGMSEEDYQNWMKYDELKQRLSATKGNILKAKRSKRSYDPEDIKGSGDGSEVDRLVKLKKSLEDRIDTLVASSPYLQDKIAQEKEKNKPQPPSIEDLTDDDLNEGQILDEWTISKWKYYAGIKK